MNSAPREFSSSSIVGMSEAAKKRAARDHDRFQEDPGRAGTIIANIGHRLRPCKQCNGRTRPPGQAGFAYEDCDLCHGKKVLPARARKARR